ncbi:MAG TPA: hypothetical protein PLU26_16010 [Candidatus Competibacter sp.]|nr:hypothetical protein [Candidatus Competibacteraceae bacterium]HUM95952.1 hypothetical protein [Candidatus Competibacter sp.]
MTIETDLQADAQERLTDCLAEALTAFNDVGNATADLIQAGGDRRAAVRQCLWFCNIVAEQAVKLRTLLALDQKGNE